MDCKSTLPQYTELSNGKKPLTQSQPRCHSKALLGVVVGLCLAAVVVACAVGGVALYRTSGTNGELDLESKERIHSMVVEGGQIAKRSATRANCSSEITNDSIPVAHISGRGIKWGTIEPPRLVEGELPISSYGTRWNCESTHGHSFVNGGMNFTHDDQRLYFPTCGYYHISSQVLFQYSLRDNDNEKKNISAFHGIEIRPNCGPNSIPYYLYSHSSLVQREDITTSTYIGDVAKICEGGSIRVIIPTRKNLCCAQGDSMRTYFSAFLVDETDC